MNGHMKAQTRAAHIRGLHRRSVLFTQDLDNATKEEVAKEIEARRQAALQINQRNERTRRNSVLALEEREDGELAVREGQKKRLFLISPKSDFRESAEIFQF